MGTQAFLLLWCLVHVSFSQSVWDRVVEDPDLQSLEDLLKSLSLDSQLSSGTQTWTVFAPENDAFKSIVNVLWNQDLHIISGIQNIVNNTVITSVNSFLWVFEFKGTLLVCSKNCGSYLESVSATNGVVHMIDTVIKPRSKLSVGKYISEDPDLATFWKVTNDNLQSDLFAFGPTQTFTVFAPTESAWDNTFSPDQFACFSVVDIFNIIKYHIIPNTVLPSFLLENKLYNTLSTFQLPVLTSATSIFVDSSLVQEEDIFGTNGVVHKIRNVLVPPTYNYDWFKRNCNIKNSLWDTITIDPSYDTFVTSLENLGYADEFSNSKKKTQWSLLAPSDTAFLLLSTEQKESVSFSLLVLKGAFALEDGILLPTQDPQSFVRLFKTKSGNWTVCSENCVNIIGIIESENGIIYQTDLVLLPSLGGTITDLVNTPPFDLLQTMIYATGYEEILSKPGNTTLFAPSDKAFVSSILATQLVCLLDGKHNNDLKVILESLIFDTQIIAPFQFETAVYSDGATWSIASTNVTTKSTIFTSSTTKIVIESNKTVVTLNKTSTVVETLYASNGVVHVLDEVLLPVQYDYDWFQENCEGAWTSVSAALSLTLALYYLAFQ